MKLSDLLEEKKTEIANKAIEAYKQGNLSPALLFRALKPAILQLKSEGYKIKEIQDFLQDAFGIVFKYDTFQKWVKRNIPLNAPKSPANAKTNITQGLTPLQGKKSLTGQNKSDSEQKGSVEPEKTKKEAKDVNPIDILNSNIHLTDDKYKDLL